MITDSVSGVCKRGFRVFCVCSQMCEDKHALRSCSHRPRRGRNGGQGADINTVTGLAQRRGHHHNRGCTEGGRRHGTGQDDMMAADHDRRQGSHGLDMGLQPTHPRHLSDDTDTASHPDMAPHRAHRHNTRPTANTATAPTSEHTFTWNTRYRRPTSQEGTRRRRRRENASANTAPTPHRRDGRLHRNLRRPTSQHWMPR